MLIAETHPQNIRGLAMGLAQTGLAFGLLCGPLIGGLLIQRLGRRRTFQLAAAIVLATSSGFFALRHLGIWAFYVCVGLLGVAMGVQKSSSQSLLVDLVDKHELGELQL